LPVLRYLCYMSTAELKSRLHQLIDEATDNAVLQAIYTLLKKVDSEADWWDDLTDEQKASVSRGLDDIKNGNTTSHNKAMSELDEHIKKHG